MSPATLHTDGGARGNPGPAGSGFVLQLSADKTIKQGSYLGEMTNNQAEYRALLAGLKQAQAEGVRELICYLDSELIVNQLNGSYRVKDAKLAPLYREAQTISASFNQISFHHVPRAKNAHADELVNRAIDAALKLRKVTRNK